MDFGSNSKEAQRKRGVSSTEEEHTYKILIVFFFFLEGGVDVGFDR